MIKVDSLPPKARGVVAELLGLAKYKPSGTGEQ